MSTRTKVILIIYFIIGLPALPVGILWALFKRYLFPNKDYFAPQNREVLLIECTSCMVAYTLFFGIVFGLLYLIKP